MRALPHRLDVETVRMEVVTNAFVASGTPDGIHDLGRLLEQMNAGALGDSIELHDAALRPLYRAARPLRLDAPIVVRREQVIFCNFEGPHFTRGAADLPMADAPVLLLVPPFQIRGVIACRPEADRTQGLRGQLDRFFVVRDARVYDAEGNELGEGEQIVVNGAAVQMMSATSLHIPSLQASPVRIERMDDDEEDEADAFTRIRVA